MYGSEKVNMISMQLRWLESAGLIHVTPFSVLFKVDTTSAIYKLDFMIN